VDNTLPRFHLTTGKVLQASSIVVDDSDNVSGVGTFSAGAAGFTVDADGDVVMKSATVTPSAAPQWEFNDSDGLGADKSAAWVKANMTTLTDGAEDADIWFEVIQGGVENTEVLRFDESDDRWESTRSWELAAGKLYTVAGEAIHAQNVTG
jgi:hypothetical protein